MIFPGMTAVDGRVYISDAAPSYYSNGVGWTSAGYLAVRTDAPDGSSNYNGGIASKAGRIHVTTTASVSDVYLGGARVSTAGAVVVAETTANGDSLFASVVALLHLNGADGATTFTDVIGNVWTAANQAQLDTAIKKFGTAALLLDGVNDHIETPSSTPLQLGNSDFCIEGWVRFSALTAGTSYVWVAKWATAGGQRSYDIYYDVDTHTLKFEYSTDGGSGTVASFSSDVGVLVTDTWYFLAVNRSGANLQIFLNGVQKGVTHNIGTTTMFASTGPLNLGERTSGTLDFAGSMDEFRFTKASRYTSNFSVPTTQFPNGLPGSYVNGNPVNASGALCVEFV